jgi:hypothetical protein
MARAVCEGGAATLFEASDNPATPWSVLAPVTTAVVCAVCPGSVARLKPSKGVQEVRDAFLDAFRRGLCSAPCFGAVLTRLVTRLVRDASGSSEAAAALVPTLAGCVPEMLVSVGDGCLVLDEAMAQCVVAGLGLVCLHPSVLRRCQSAAMGDAGLRFASRVLHLGECPLSLRAGLVAELMKAVCLSVGRAEETVGRPGGGTGALGPFAVPHLVGYVTLCTLHVRPLTWDLVDVCVHAIETALLVFGPQGLEPCGQWLCAVLGGVGPDNVSHPAVARALRAVTMLSRSSAEVARDDFAYAAVACDLADLLPAQVTGSALLRLQCGVLRLWWGCVRRTGPFLGDVACLLRDRHMEFLLRCVRAASDDARQPTAGTEASAVMTCAEAAAVVLLCVVCPGDVAVAGEFLRAVAGRLLPWPELVVACAHRVSQVVQGASLPQMPWDELTVVRLHPAMGFDDWREAPPPEICGGSGT